jgi:GH15 family glucan-1,4-alpha-glucosidase
MPYKPIEQYGVIGNMHTAALVGVDGSLDWYCVPRFDSPSVFGALLDDRKGGRFQIAPVDDGVKHKQLYWPETNVLVTRFFSPDGVGQLIDCLPVAGTPDGLGLPLIRRVSVPRGTMRFRARCRPAFNFGRDRHETDVVDHRVAFRTRALSLSLTAPVSFARAGDGVIAEFTLNEEESATFVLRQVDPGSEQDARLPERELRDLITATIEYWHGWLSKCTYQGRWREMVFRSALALKLMTFEPTGAIVAAPTCSLPEEVGGQRNWDYRYTWIRDAAFTLYALMRIGFTDEASRFMAFLEARTHELEKDGSLQVMYGIDGRHTLDEERLDHLDGYRGSRPVRVGNAAYRQLQLDIYGELMDSVYLYNKYGTQISYHLWVELRRMMEWLCRNWQRQDDGIWETRGGSQHFVYSKILCWVALDRALRLAEKRSFPADWGTWLQTRDAIYEEIVEKGWNPSRQAMVQHYGSDALDAATLIMPLVFFVSPTDPLMLKTLDAIRRPPGKGGLESNSLVYRYNVERAPDGLRGPEGTFNICSFWLVEALTRAGRVDAARLADARVIFEQMLGYANHLGLYAEQIGPCGEALGNFPQAFTHLSLISAAVNLDRTLGGHRG